MELKRKFTISNNNYELTGCNLVNEGFTWVHTVKNTTNGVTKTMTLDKLQQLFEKYDVKFVN